MPGTITFVRLNRRQDRWRNYSVWIDGERIGNVKNASGFTVPVCAGAHALQVGIDWVRSSEITVHVEESQVIEINIAPSAFGLRAMFRALFTPTEYFEIRQLQSS